jgi:hypothetical protein
LADGVADIRELPAEREGQCGKLLKARPSLTIEAIQQLAEAIRDLAEVFD